MLQHHPYLNVISFFKIERRDRIEVVLVAKKPQRVWHKDGFFYSFRSVVLNWREQETRKRDRVRERERERERG